MSGAIAIFVKTPGLSPVKTRLAETIGHDRAERFHLAAARAVREVAVEACRLSDMNTYFAVAEAAGIDHPFWNGLPCLTQRGEGLGERMAYIYRTLSREHDFVMLTGADIPQMRTNDLLEGAAWLSAEARRTVFGPSADGGFWLFGGNVPVPETVWTEVTYGCSDTGEQFCNRVLESGDLKRLPQLRDVDEATDLPYLCQALSELKKPLPMQRELLRNMSEMFLSTN